MEQKKINIIFAACLVVLAFLCFRQNERIEQLEYDISSLEYDLSHAQNDIQKLQKDYNYLAIDVDELQSGPEPQNTQSQKQKAIERIQRFNAEREEEARQGIVNSDPKIATERRYLNIEKKIYQLDIEIR